MAGVELKKIAIIGDGQFADGAMVSALIKSGVVEFVDPMDTGDGGIPDEEKKLKGAAGEHVVDRESI
jgi:hypothetical protein